MLKTENRKIVNEIDRAGQSLIDCMGLVPSKEMNDAIVAIRASINTAKRLASNSNIAEMQDWARRLLETTASGV